MKTIAEKEIDPLPYLIRDPNTPNETIYQLLEGTNTIGREFDNTIVLEQESRDLSRHHAEIVVTNDRAVIVDRNSRNGTFVNHHKISHQALKDGDVIHLGKVAFKFVQAPISALEEAVSAKLSDLSIISRFQPEYTFVDLQALLRSEQPQQRGSILKLRQQESQQRTADKLKILLEVSKQLSSPEQSDKLLDKILDLLFTIMDVDRAAILLHNEELQQLELQAAKFREGITADLQFYSKRIVNFVYENGDAILTADARNDERFRDSTSVLGQSIHASIGVPLKPHDRLIGVLYVDNLSIANVYSQEDLEFLTALATQAAIAIENVRLSQKMRSEAVMRARLERFFPQAIAQRLREESALRVIETEVTALFSDISGFTELSSQMRPRQVLELLNEYFKVMVEDIVFRYEGTLEKYIADALLAVWGSPYSHPQDADRAVRAAIAMQWAMHKLNQRWSAQRGLQVQIHIGLNTGMVAAGNIGSEKLIQYTNIGDTMNVASRICGVAKAGEIVISRSTLEKLHTPNLIVEPLPPVQVKGKEAPLELYRILWEQIETETI
ncbi:MAG: adenylate/guanylate cyclase domain-containing protein [Leptolyngbyaceae cyanobacterium bins.59]|nr:adenylate/guanylate cyclase domain-containing protein [Leptolyngbyaceae cyanobacterium bins.59]